MSLNVAMLIDKCCWRLYFYNSLHCCCCCCISPSKAITLNDVTREKRQREREKERERKRERKICNKFSVWATLERGGPSENRLPLHPVSRGSLDCAEKEGLSRVGGQHWLPSLRLKWNGIVWHWNKSLYLTFFEMLTLLCLCIFISSLEMDSLSPSLSLSSLFFLPVRQVLDIVDHWSIFLSYLIVWM